MRQVILQVPTGFGEEVLARAERLGGTNLVVVPGRNRDADCDIVFAHVVNEGVDDLLADVQDLADVHATVFPQGVLALSPPADEPPGALLDVTPRSPIEVLLAGLQSAGSWSSFLAYSAIAGIVTWVGLYGDTMYLLTASMLIAPFAGPAVNAAIASASGETDLLRHALGRYAAAIGLASAVAAALTFVFRLTVATELMNSVTTLSVVHVLLPLAAGAAGGLYLVNSEHSNLISGAAVGMLVAASLAPPTGVLGAAAVLGRFDLVGRAAFVIVLQLLGINLVAAGIFRLYGLRPRRVRFGQGRTGLFLATVVGCALLVGGLVAWQAGQPGWGRESDLARAVVVDASRALEQHAGVELLDAEVTTGRFASTREYIHAEISVVTSEPSGATDELRRSIQRDVEAQLDSGDRVPVVDVTVLSPAR